MAFEHALQCEGLPVANFNAERMSSGSIRVDSSWGIIGTVHLRRKFGSIQYFISAMDIHNMDDAPAEAIIAVIPYWISYSKALISSYQTATRV